MVEQRPFKPKVVGPIPTAPTNISFSDNQLQICDGNDAHHSKLLRDVFQHLSKFVCRKSFRLPFSFRTVFYAREAHGVELISDQLPAHRGVKIKRALDS